MNILELLTKRNSAHRCLKSYGAQAWPCCCYLSCTASCRSPMCPPAFLAARLQQHSATGANLDAWPAAPDSPGAPARAHPLPPNLQRSPECWRFDMSMRTTVETQLSQYRKLAHELDCSEGTHHGIQCHHRCVGDVTVDVVGEADIKIILSLLALELLPLQLSCKFSSGIPSCCASIIVRCACMIV